MKVYLTPIVFGGYYYELKKGLDRQICNLLPFFIKVKGDEAHHPLRFEKKSNLIGIGVLPKPDVESEAIFKTLIERNSINMHAETHSAVTIYLTDNTEQVAQKIKEALIKARMKKVDSPKHVLLLVGSPKAANSTHDRLAHTYSKIWVTTDLILTQFMSKHLCGRLKVNGRYLSWLRQATS